MSETVDNLLDRAENMIRMKGFHAVSFRDLADELGIKSSSVHYHFPQKQDLGVALVERYAGRIFAALEQKCETAREPQDYLNELVSVYRVALTGSDRICLCGILGAESAGLPPEVASAVSDFLNSNIEWLASHLPENPDPAHNLAFATRIISVLQGAMMLANSLGDHSVFDRAVAGLKVNELTAAA